MTSPRSGESSAEKETGRLESFSDGVFSIAMTLLILELTVPGLTVDRSHWTARQLLIALVRQWPHYLAFVTSFFTVLIMWVNHHGIFRLIHRTDTRLLIANGFLLLLVTFVPFPTDLIADYLPTPAAATACAVYAGTFVLISISYALVLVAARRNDGRLLAPHAKPEVERRLRDCYFVGTPLYLLATIVAPWKPWLTIVICTVLWIFWSIGRDEKGSAFGR
jgi:uncharacterized membrane protein